MKEVTRREFIQTGASFVAVWGLAACDKTTAPPPLKEAPPVLMPTRPFGKTGYDVGIFSLGGQAALETPGEEDLSEEIINRALDLGVNYIDTSAYYGSEVGQPGLSERNIGRATSSRRDDVFIATKTLARNYDGAMRDLEQSLTNLKTDQVDLWQVHNIRTINDLSLVSKPNGALKAFDQAKTEGTTRLIGVTGHYDPSVLKLMIDVHDFDAVLMALNAADIHYNSFIEQALPTAVQKEMGIVAMKIPARGRIFKEGGITTMEQALGYTLTLPVSTAIVGCSTVAEVEDNVELARNYAPYSDDEMKELEALTEPYYWEGGFFKWDW